MKIDIKYKNQEFLATLDNVDLTKSKRKVSEIIKNLIDTCAVVVIKNQHLNDEQQIAFSKKLGPLEKALPHDTHQNMNPEISRISNVNYNNELLSINSKKVIYDRGNRAWHTDSSYKMIPAKYSILNAREIPNSSGATQFADARFALENWGETRIQSLKTLSKLLCYHSIVYSRMQNTGNIFDDEYKKNMPFVKQRLIRMHPKTKRCAFYAGSHCSHIESWDLDEGRNLIKVINDWIVNSSPIYAHNWSEGDLVIWDNRRVLHRGTDYDEKNSRRIMHRTTVAGDKSSLEEDFILKERL